MLKSDWFLHFAMLLKAVPNTAQLNEEWEELLTANAWNIHSDLETGNVSPSLFTNRIYDSSYFFPHHFTVIVIHPFRFCVCSWEISSGILQINRCALLYFPFPHHSCLHSFPFLLALSERTGVFTLMLWKIGKCFQCTHIHTQNANEEENCMIGNLHLLSNAASFNGSTYPQVNMHVPHTINHGWFQTIAKISFFPSFSACFDAIANRVFEPQIPKCTIQRENAMPLFRLNWKLKHDFYFWFSKLKRLLLFAVRLIYAYESASINFRSRRKKVKKCQDEHAIEKLWLFLSLLQYLNSNTQHKVSCWKIIMTTFIPSIRCCIA